MNDEKIYRQILELPFISRSYFCLFENYSVSDVLEDSIEEFRDMYKGLFKELEPYGIVVTSDNKISLTNSIRLRQHLVSELPSKILSRLLSMNVDSKKVSKLIDRFDNRVRNSFVREFNSDKYFLLENSIKRILSKHRKSRLFLILMSKWFFILFTVFKLVVKGTVLIVLYKKLYIVFT